ncbi:MAG TPA: hypothetical protein VNA20_11870 [Frankiaceae bacterium]|nr:hypothetical protein [Frankiaceae bacterium]
MTIRTAAVAAVVATIAVGAPAASAAPKKKLPPPVCNLVVDDKGEPTSDGPLDILSADIATDSKKLTGVIRVAGDPDAAGPTSPTGRIYHLSFSGASPSTNVFLSFIYAPTGQAATYGFFNKTTMVNEGVGAATLKIVGNDIYMTVPHSVYSAYGKFKPGNKITGLTASTGRMAGVFVSTDAYAYNPVTGDNAPEGKAYTSGARSCVRVGGPA